MKKNRKRLGKKNPELKLIIFDFDGTLVDSVPGIQKNANEMAKVYGMKPVSRARVVKSVGAGLNKFLEWVFKPELKKRDILELRKEYIKRYKNNYKYKIKTYPGVRRTLAMLKRKKIKTAIVSNKAAKFINKSNRYLGIKKYFSLVLGRGDLRKDKPHPYPIIHTMKKYGAKKDETLFVGDSRYDIECAKKAGVKSLYLTYGYGERKKSMRLKPDYVSSKISIIRELAEKW